MTHSKYNFTHNITSSKFNFHNAIAGYLSRHDTDDRVNMYILATQPALTLVVGEPNVKRSELDDDQLNIFSMVEDLAASHIALNDVHPVEAVVIAYHEIVSRDVEALSVLFKMTSLPYVDTKLLLPKRRAILDLMGFSDWLYYGTKDAWLHSSLPSGQ